MEHGPGYTYDITNSFWPISYILQLRTMSVFSHSTPPDFTKTTAQSGAFFSKSVSYVKTEQIRLKIFTELKERLTLWCQQSRKERADGKM